MAKQAGIFKFEGKLGDVVGYSDHGEYYVKTIGKTDKEARMYAPQYEVTRQNEAEFGVATRCGQLFRQAMMHITQRWTQRDYPPDVVSAMLQILRSDTTHDKGQKTIHCGLKNAESKMAFRRLQIYQKKPYMHYRGSLLHETGDPWVWKLNHQVLWSKTNDGNTKSVKLGFLHIDFDRKTAAYEDALSITCNRNDQIDFSEIHLEPSRDKQMPWTFVILQVWRDGDLYEPTGLLFMNVLQVMDADEYGKQVVKITEGQSLQVEVSLQKRMVDTNGVDWDVFLDGYLSDGLTEWAMDDGEEDKLERLVDAEALGLQGKPKEVEELLLADDQVQVVSKGKYERVLDDVIKSGEKEENHARKKAYKIHINPNIYKTSTAEVLDLDFVLENRLKNRREIYSNPNLEKTMTLENMERPG